MRLGFIADAMLGRLAKKLRLLGYDCKYFSDIADDDLIKLAKDENRILLTRDEQLANIAKKQELFIIPIKKEQDVDQILEINSMLKLNDFEIKGEISRCSVCNGELLKIPKDKAKNKIPSGVLEIVDEFWRCDGCGRIYWEGTHIKNLQRFVDELNERTN